MSRYSNVCSVQLERPQTECGNTRRGLTHPNHLTDWRAALQSTETWLPIPGYEGLYEASNEGRIRSLPRVVRRADGALVPVAGGILSQKTGRHYLAVSLCRGGITRTSNVHRLVCAAFYGAAQPDLPVVRHLNGDYLDNRAVNLCWGTYAENTADMMAHGRHFWANKTHCPQGHEYTPENTQRYKNRRNCRECWRLRSIPKNEARHQRLLEARLAKPCRVCGLEFVAHPRAAFCSPECKKASRRKAYLVEIGRGVSRG